MFTAETKPKSDIATRVLQLTSKRVRKQLHACQIKTSALLHVSVTMPPASF